MTLALFALTAIWSSGAMNSLSVANLSGKTALVTGASAGISKATVALIEHGAKIIATGRRQEALDALLRSTALTGSEPVAILTTILSPGSLPRRRRLKSW